MRRRVRANFSAEQRARIFPARQGHLIFWNKSHFSKCSCGRTHKKKTSSSLPHCRLLLDRGSCLSSSRALLYQVHCFPYIICKRMCRLLDRRPRLKPKSCGKVEPQRVRERRPSTERSLVRCRYGACCSRQSRREPHPCCEIRGQVPSASQRPSRYPPTPTVPRLERSKHPQSRQHTRRQPRKQNF